METSCKIQIKMNSNSKPQTVYICGISKVPEKTVYKHIFGYFTIVLAIDTETKTIKSLTYTCPFTDCPGRNEIEGILIGKKVNEGISDFTEWSRKAIICPIRKAIIAAFDDTLTKWSKIENNF
jgi:hypothetical protein